MHQSKLSLAVPNVQYPQNGIRARLALLDVLDAMDAYFSNTG